jgi:hypothetical protein
MKELQSFNFKPKYQRQGKPEVTFELQPLDQRTYLILKGESTLRRGSVDVSPDGVLVAFRYAVKGWAGLDQPFSEDARQEAMYGAANVHMANWQAEIAEALIKRAVLGEPEIKN